MNLSILKTLPLSLFLYSGVLVYLAWPLSLLYRPAGVMLALAALLALPVLCLVSAIRLRLWQYRRVLFTVATPAAVVALYKVISFFGGALWNF